MTIDHSGDFDATRVGRRQRRAAIRSIRRATSLTAADRDLRVQQARAAHTRGELNALTRGIDEVRAMVPAPRPPTAPPPVRPGYGSFVPPAVPPSFVPTAAGPPPRPQAVPLPGRGQPAAWRSYSAKLVIALVSLVLVCGGSVVSCVSSLVGSVSDISSGSSPRLPDLATTSGLTDMRAAFDDQIDSDDAVLLVVDRRSAVLSVPTGSTAAERYLYDGDVTRANEVQRVASEQTFDLDDLDLGVVLAAVRRARLASGVTDDDARLQITGGASGPRTLVTFPRSTRSTYALLVDRDGSVVYETD